MESSEEDYYDYTEYNNNSSNFSYDDYQTICEKSDVRSFVRIFLPVVFGLCLVIGLAGNALVLAVYAYCKQLKTLTDVFIVHLAVADLLLLLTLPFWAADAVHGWELGVTLCKLVSSLYTINFTCSMMLLAHISLDQYLALMAGDRSRGLAQIFQKKHSGKLCFGGWTVACFLGIPDLVFSTVSEFHHKKRCLAMYPSDVAHKAKASLEVMEVMIGFLFPLLVMLYCYICVGRALVMLPAERRSRKWRSIRVLLAMVGVFVVTQLPYNVVKFFRAMNIVYTFVTHCGLSKGLDRAMQITEGLALTHCCLNPVLYTFIGSSFRQHVLKCAKGFGDRGRRLARVREQQEVNISLNSHSQSQETSTFSI
ncbi:atypical chemokine receptor 4 isoform X2 [Triplophysa rosa]|uniref:Atypical chemokine receptor 4 n=2 Tax=Triplophysa rosa TaxID=992332 RepID=A0A9W7WW64_TRIRA|nr:atypical chemokine receptor 4 isoform X2 [Triplophysa rosa]XP_057189150.1 atypical chemokine receptor 4 isoform X2 [Triplophysa rosa]KAI7809732.1 putative atypical chemokine receptor 4 [Triplophysa rosa]